MAKKKPSAEGPAADLRERILDDIQAQYATRRRALLKAGFPDTREFRNEVVITASADYRKQADEFLREPLFRNVWRAYASIPLASKEVVPLLSWLVRAQDCWAFMQEVDPKTAVSAHDAHLGPTLERLLGQARLTEIRGHIAKAIDSSRSRAHHRWARWIDPMWISTERTRLQQWRGVLVRGLNAQLPDATSDRARTIAALLRLAGDRTIRSKHVLNALRKSC